MIPLEVKILSSRKFYSADPARAGKFDTAITYRATAEAEPHFVILPTDDPTEAAIRAAIAKDLEVRSKHVGKIMQVG